MKYAGFARPSHSDAEDLALWMPGPGSVTSGMDRDVARYVIENIADRFCQLVQQEREATTWVDEHGE